MSKNANVASENNKQDNRIIFSFDIGIASLGEAVRNGIEIVHANSLLIDPNIGSLQDERERRHAYRTREAHKKREEILINLWKKIGETPLLGDTLQKTENGWHEQVGDEKLKREFPQDGDNTVYTSCLLRIMLLEGEQLKSWQIYKALHSALQRRGYDANVPWRTGKSGNTSSEQNTKSNGTSETLSKNEEDELKNKEKVAEFEKEIKTISPDPKHHFPCYYDAYRMGLWRDGKIVAHRLDQNQIARARGYVAPRAMVVQELRCLLKQAAKQLPQLIKYVDNEEKINNLLFGEENTALPKDYRQYPSTKHLGGLLAQKLPRFDNRAVGKCCLIPRFHVCRKSDKLFIQVSFLLKLVNFRYYKINTSTGEVQPSCALSSVEINAYFNQKIQQWNIDNQQLIAKYGEAVALTKIFRWTKSDTKKYVKDLSGNVKGEHQEITSLENTKGRCRFSRPALAIMQELILSGKWQQPDTFREELIARMSPADNKDGHGDRWLKIDLNTLHNKDKNEDSHPKTGAEQISENKYRFRMFESDILFLSKMSDAQGRFYVPSLTLIEKFQTENIDSHNAINTLIASCRNPTVRHRLTFFAKRLETLIQAHGRPHHVCLEFVREDFMGKKRKDKYVKERNQGQTDKKDAIKKLCELKTEVSDRNIEKTRLRKGQHCMCIYTGEAIGSNLEHYEIDHIVPQAKGGPDSLYNKVLVHSPMFNRKTKLDKIPYEIPEIRDNWQSYEGRVKKTIKDPKKRKLLLATSFEEAQQLVEKYTGLAATAEIARLARDIVCLRMGWQPGEKNIERHVSVISGGLTHRVAKKYSLYTILGDGNSSTYVKNRADNRHHALDAMIISYIPEWARDPKKTYWFRLPSGIHKEYFAEKLKDVYPRLVYKHKAEIAEQPLARQWDVKEKKYKMIQHKEGTQKPTTGNYNPKIYHNLRKDKSAGRGIWYTSRKIKDTGTRSHGCLVVYSDAKKPEVRPVHAFASPYKLMHSYRLQKKIPRLLRAGDLIEIQNNNGATVTKLGDTTNITREHYGKYIINKKMAKTYRIMDLPGAPPFKCDVKIKDIERIYKEKQASVLIRTGAIVEFKNAFNYGGRGENITGKWSFIGAEEYRLHIELVSEETQEKIITNYKKLYGYLIREIVTAPQFGVGDTIEINSRISGTLPDTPDTILPNGRYKIKKFAGGMKDIIIQDNRSVQFRSKTANIAQLIVRKDNVVPEE